VSDPTPRYQVEHASDALETHVLHDHETKARVVLAPSRGGMLTRFSLDGEPVLFLDEASLRDKTKNVRGGVPILFPIAGKLAGDTLSLDGANFPMKQHGFARNLPWKVEAERAADEASVTLVLRDDDTTRAQYPFSFAVTFVYRLRDGVLRIEQRFENTGDKPMPIQPGLHPYFALPDARKREARVFTDATRAWDNKAGQATTIRGGIDLVAEEVDLHLLDHRPREARLQRPGMRNVTLRFGEDQKVLVVWTLRGRDFVCVEPWTRSANALNEGKGIVVPPGGAHVTLLVITAS
jgi:galactose mutarotase-like enzyme